MVNKDELSFEILGHRFKFRAESDDNLDPKDVVKEVRDSLLKIQRTSDDLDPGKLAILVALELASKKLKIEAEYRFNIEKFHSEATQALKSLDIEPPSFQ